MTPTRSKRESLSQEEIERLEPYYRLVELQREIIEVLRQKAETERRCALLRERLARESELFLRSRRSRLFRTWLVVAGLFQRFCMRPAPPAGSGQGGASSRVSTGSKDWDCVLSQPQPLQE